MAGTREGQDVVKWILLGVVLLGVVMALMEWNARRQAAAMTRELMRPATAEEEQQIRAATDEMMRQVEADFPQTPSPLQDPAQGNMGWARGAERTQVLAPGERCISGQRFRRITNGWEEIGTC